MCDYSLAEYSSRIARNNEILVPYKFGTGSIGLIAEHDAITKGRSPCAVCVPPGARLCVSDISPDIQKFNGVSVVEDVTFTQTSAAEYRHRDAIQFANGNVVKLQHLTNERILVLSVEGSEKPAKQSQGELVAAGASGGSRRNLFTRFFGAD